jgi:beta-glucosidase
MGHDDSVSSKFENRSKLTRYRYNKLDGTYCSESPILQQVLREEWDFAGCIISDWFGTRSSLPALKAGLDLEMPGPSVFRGAEVLSYVKAGLLSEDVIDDRARSVLGVIHKTTPSHSKDNLEVSIISESANILARQVAAEGIVLLKNKNSVLPLNLAAKPKLAVIGPYAIVSPIGGGGSAKVPAQYVHSSLSILQSTHPDPSLVQYLSGCTCHVTIPSIPLSLTKTKNGQLGVEVSYFIHGSSEPVIREHVPSTFTTMFGSLKSPLTPSTFSHYTVSTSITPVSSGTHTIAIQSTGAFSLTVGEEIILSDDMQPPPSVEDFLFVPTALERSVRIPMVAGQQYNITATVQPYAPVEETGEPRVHSAKLCFMEDYSSFELSSSAAKLASNSDVSIIFAGRNDAMESEGFDLASIKLLNEQEEMIRQVARSSRKIILVLYGGNPIDISAYEDIVDAIIFVHFPGQEGSQALIDILTGDACPSGRLATSWPMNLESVPSFEAFPSKQNDDGEWEMRYLEGLEVGYRQRNYQPRYPFGYGLSYTCFRYSGLKVQVNTCSGNPDNGSVSISLEVENIGAIAGHEVIQVFISDNETSIWRPEKELKGFEKIWLEAGEKKIVSITILKQIAFCFWDDRQNGRECWRAEEGDFTIRVGDLEEIVTLEAGFIWTGL